MILGLLVGWELSLAAVLTPQYGLILLLTILPLPFLIVAFRGDYITDVTVLMTKLRWTRGRMIWTLRALEGAAIGLALSAFFIILSVRSATYYPEEFNFLAIALATAICLIGVNGVLTRRAIRQVSGTS